jgi:hypothetical protein
MRSQICDLIPLKSRYSKRDVPIPGSEQIEELTPWAVAARYDDRTGVVRNLAGRCGREGWRPGRVLDGEGLCDVLEAFALGFHAEDELRETAEDHHHRAE